MGGEHIPVIVYGFKTSIIFMDSDDFEICLTGCPGEPIYTSIVIKEPSFENITKKINDYENENCEEIDKINKWAKEKGKKYNRNFTCQWQLAVYGELEFNYIDFEEDLIQNK